MEKRYLTVSALNKYIRAKIDQDSQLQHIFIKGEISNCKHHSSGHLYFTLKDENSRINAIMFASKAKSLPFLLEDGMKVLIEASVSVYDVAGTYQISVKTLQQDGIGNLFLQFEKLKKDLLEQGLFEPNTKKQIPHYPSKIAVLSAHPSAALMDVVRTIRIRFPVVRVVIFPVPVQGKGAYKEIIKTLEYVDGLHFSSIIIARGGGSLEELWNFNEEALARTIFQCKTPIISGVGHEVDYTICDFVADKRAATPTAAATVATPNIVELKQNVNNLEYTIHGLMKQCIVSNRQKVLALSNFYIFKNPNKLTDDKRMHAIHYHQQLHNAFTNKMVNTNSKYQYLEQKFNHQMEIFSVQQNNKLEVLKHKLEQSLQLKMKKQQEKFYFLISRLNTVSPIKTLERGYAIVVKDEQTITSKTMLKSGDRITIKLKDGNVDANIK